MIEGLDFYKEAESTVGNKGFEHEEIVDVMILEEAYPSTYLKRLAETNDKSISDASSLGADFSPRQPSYKEGGIAIKFAVIRRITQGKSENVFIEDGNELIEPYYSTYGTFTHLAPPLALKIKSDSGFLYGDMQRDGGGNKIVAGKPKILPLFPSVNVVKEKNKEKDYKLLVRADSVPMGQEELYAEIIAEEQRRIQDWQKIINIWKDLTEAQARESGLEWIARRLLICQSTDKGVNYLTPTKGMIFRVAISRKEDSKYFNIEAFGQWTKRTVDGKDKWSRPIYSNCQIKLPSMVDIEYADLIIRTRDENIARRSEAKANKANAPVKPDEEEEYTF